MISPASRVSSVASRYQTPPPIISDGCQTNLRCHLRGTFTGVRGTNVRQRKEKWVRTFLDLTNGIPSHDISPAASILP